MAHPVLKARYNDLLWVFTYPVIKARPRIEYAHAAIDSYITIADEELFDDSMSGIQYLERAARLGKLISDSDRVEKCKRSLFRLHEKIAVPQQPGTWSFLYDSLIEQKLAPLNDSEEKLIVRSLEDILTECSLVDSGAKFDPFSAQAAGERLAKYYRKAGKDEDVQRVTLQWGRAFEAISEKAEGGLAMTWLQPVFEAYRAVNLTEDAERVQLAAREKGRTSLFKEATGSVQISQAELDAFFDAMTEGDLTQSLKRIAVRYIPRIKEAQDALKRVMKETPLIALLPRTLVSEGQIVGRVGSIEDDPDGHLVMEISQRIGLGALGLKGCIDKLKSKFGLTAKDLADFIFASPLFLEDRKEIVQEGIDAWFSGDNLKAIHVLIPQIEHALRVLLALLGRPTNKPKRSAVGIMEELNLNDILAEQEIKDILTEDVHLYLRTLLADQRGYNLRNVISHGLQPASFFNENIANRLIHVLTLFGMIREDAEKKNQV